MARENPADYLYTQSHEWLKEESGVGTCGITDYAQGLLTDVVFIDLPATGQKVQRGEKLTVVESVKSVSEIYAPVSGEILEVNADLSNSPDWINKDAFGQGWICRIKIADPAELAALLSKVDYDKYVAEAAH